MPKVTVTTARGLIQETGEAPASFAPGLGIGAQSITAVGSAIGDAAQIGANSGGLVLVTGANGTKAVKLPALSSVPAGTMYMILNLDGSNALEVFPTANDKIHPASDNDPITVAAKGMLICIADSAGVLWASAEPAATGV